MRHCANALDARPSLPKQIESGIAADVRFHGLRRTGDNLVAAKASARELMTRMGHITGRAALTCQHISADRDGAIVDRLGTVIRKQQ
ncbi:hypothetical protein AB0C40_15775 [Streptomyces brevispora]|uniref:hypothetical protein n=1 Tax=Streptomyces brevispora TaxID=887462 RepID=UPI0033F92BA3